MIPEIVAPRACTHSSCSLWNREFYERRALGLNFVHFLSDKLCCHDHGNQGDHSIGDVTTESGQHFPSQVRKNEK